MAKPGKTKNGKGGKRSKAESMTGAKASETEVRKGELELKAIEIDDGDFDLHLRSLKGAKEKFDTAKRLYDSCCKAAKKVSAELLDAVKRAIKFEGMDEHDIKRQLEIDGYVLKRSGSSVQLTIHDTLLGDEVELAYKRGHDAGGNGRSLVNPYPASSDLAEAYSTGWRNAVGGTLGLTEDETEEAVADDAARDSEREPATLQ